MKKQNLTKEDKAKFRAAGENSLLRAGVGRVYFDLKLATFGAAGKQILDRMDDTAAFKKWVRSGGGFLLDCRTEKTFSIAPCLTRAMRLTGIDVRLVGTIDLVDYLEAAKDEDFSYSVFDEFENAAALVIRRFAEPGYTPNTAQQLQRLEYYLMKRMENGLSVSVQYQGDLRAQKLWSPYFAGMLTERNERVSV